jgi:hypothetical protein
MVPVPPKTKVGCPGPGDPTWSVRLAKELVGDSVGGVAVGD